MSATPAKAVKAGDIIADKYRVERMLGTGGMGYVLAARHLQLDQLVAIKFLRAAPPPEAGLTPAPAPDANRRFLREAKAAVKLRNEHVARVFDVGTHDSGEPYIVMEYLEGRDLSALSKDRGPISAAEATEYVLQACEALAEAHAAGIVHRDIKLANLFVTNGPANVPMVKVLDFGVSKINPFGEGDQEMTRSTAMLGSPKFMAPEQMRDPRMVDGRSDVWSLGVCLYRLTSARAPFQGPTLGALMSAVMHESHTPLATLMPMLPPGFVAVVDRCLTKDPNARFTNMGELANALLPFASEQSRARATVDRIIAMSPLPATAPTPPPAETSSTYSAGPSTPPGASDTGSPWSETRAQNRAAASSRTTMLASAALVVVLALTAGYVKVHHDRSVAAAAQAPKAASSRLPERAPASAETTPAPSSQAVAITTTVIPTMVPSALPDPTPTPSFSNVSASGASTGRRAGGATHSKTKPKSSAAGPDDGIPMTRD